MDLKRQRIDSFTFSGLRVRTANAQEHNRETAQIEAYTGPESVSIYIGIR